MDSGEDSLQNNEFLEIRDDIFSLEKSGVNDSDDTKFEYEVLNTEQITKDMTDCIVEVNTVAHIPPVITRILLNHLKWDKEKLYEIYYDGDKEKLFNEARILNPKQYSLVQKRKHDSSSSIYTCQICYNNYPNSKMESSECGHRFCLGCWEEYLRTKILGEGMIEAIQCAAHQCNMIVEDEIIMKILKDSKIKVKYQYLITNCFVECNRLLKWCPRPECTNAIKVQYIDSQSVTCNCGYTFCFSCSQVWHEPIKCDLFRKWEKKCDDDRDTSNWIASNTKECPKCNATIEKDGGCNHIICKNQNCRTEFCWTCLGPWEPHGSSWYKCNRYDDEVAKMARDAQQKSRAALQRYLFYYNRYMNHMQSLKLEHKLYESIKEKMEEMQENMSLIETQFLKLAVDVLCKCRQTLMYTYAFAYYLKRNNQSEIFESNQRDLENATEKLSEYLERNITKENITSIKQKVQDKFRYCERRRKVLVEHVSEGYEKMWWEYAE